MLGKEITLRILRRLLEPAVSFCLRSGLRVQDFQDLSKQVFLALAEKEILRRGDEVSISKLSVMTGIHRKHVPFHQQKGLPGFDDSDQSRNLLERLTGLWQTDSRFCRKDGKPRELSSTGMESQFIELVRSVSGDLNPYAVLYELERIKAVERKGDRICLRVAGFTPRDDWEQSFALLSRDLSILSESVEENVLGQVEPPNLHITTQYNAIPEDAVPKVREWFLAQGAELHRKARQFLSKYDKDLNPQLRKKDGNFLAALGTFSITKDLKE